MKNLIALAIMVLVFIAIFLTAMPYCEEVAETAEGEFVTAYSDIGTRVIHEVKLAAPLILLMVWTAVFGYVMYTSVKEFA